MKNKDVAIHFTKIARDKFQIYNFQTKDNQIANTRDLATYLTNLRGGIALDNSFYSKLISMPNFSTIAISEDALKIKKSASNGKLEPWKLEKTADGEVFVSAIDEEEDDTILKKSASCHLKHHYVISIKAKNENQKITTYASLKKSACIPETEIELSPINDYVNFDYYSEKNPYDVIQAIVDLLVATGVAVEPSQVECCHDFCDCGMSQVGPVVPCEENEYILDCYGEEPIIGQSVDSLRSYASAHNKKHFKIYAFDKMVFNSDSSISVKAENENKNVFTLYLYSDSNNLKHQQDYSSKKEAEDAFLDLKDDFANRKEDPVIIDYVKIKEYSSDKEEVLNSWEGDDTGSLILVSTGDKNKAKDTSANTSEISTPVLEEKKEVEEKVEEKPVEEQKEPQPLPTGEAKEEGKKKEIEEEVKTPAGQKLEEKVEEVVKSDASIENNIEKKADDTEEDLNSFEYIHSQLVNGNIDQYKQKIKEMDVPTLVKYIGWLEENQIKITDALGPLIREAIENRKLTKEALVIDNDAEYVDFSDVKPGDYFSVNEDFKAENGDSRVAVLKYNKNGDLLDWEFFETADKAYDKANSLNKETVPENSRAPFVAEQSEDKEPTKEEINHWLQVEVNRLNEEENLTKGKEADILTVNNDFKNKCVVGGSTRKILELEQYVKRKLNPSSGMRYLITVSPKEEFPGMSELTIFTSMEGADTDKLAGKKEDLSKKAIEFSNKVIVDKLEHNEYNNPTELNNALKSVVNDKKYDKEVQELKEKGKITEEQIQKAKTASVNKVAGTSDNDDFDKEDLDNIWVISPSEKTKNLIPTNEITKADLIELLNNDIAEFNKDGNGVFSDDTSLSMDISNEDLEEALINYFYAFLKEIKPAIKKESKEAPFNIPTIDESLKNDYLAGKVTLEEVKEKACEAGWFNYIPSDEQILKFMNINTSDKASFKNIEKDSASNLVDVTVKFDNGDVINTNVNGNQTDEQIRDYYKVGKTFNLGYNEETEDTLAKVVEVIINRGIDKESKVVKKDNEYQVQSEKGKNLGTYDTKEEAKDRLKEVEMFKHMDKKADTEVQEPSVSQETIQKYKEHGFVEKGSPEYEEFYNAGFTLKQSLIDKNHYYVIEIERERRASKKDDITKEADKVLVDKNTNQPLKPGEDPTNKELVEVEVDKSQTNTTTASNAIYNLFMKSAKIEIGSSGLRLLTAAYNSPLFQKVAYLGPTAFAFKDQHATFIVEGNTATCHKTSFLTDISPINKEARKGLDSLSDSELQDYINRLNAKLEVK